MSNTSHINGAKVQNRHNSNVDLVDKNNPFVRTYNTLKLPFIGINVPFGIRSPVSTKNLGFTLIELMVTIAVAAILITVAVPSMRTFVQNGRINTEVNDLLADINFARSEAIKRRTNVSICKSINGTTCTVGGVDWENGRLIFVDPAANGAVDIGDTILRFRGALGGSDTTLFSTTDSIVFAPNGTYAGAGGTTFLIFCDGRGPSKGKSVTINTVGQTTVGTPGFC